MDDDELYSSQGDEGVDLNEGKALDQEDGGSLNEDERALLADEIADNQGNIKKNHY